VLGILLVIPIKFEALSNLQANIFTKLVIAIENFDFFFIISGTYSFNVFTFWRKKKKTISKLLTVIMIFPILSVHTYANFEEKNLKSDEEAQIILVINEAIDLDQESEQYSAILIDEVSGAEFLLNVYEVETSHIII
jgi:hypothetical protein